MSPYIRASNALQLKAYLYNADTPSKVYVCFSSATQINWEGIIKPSQIMPFFWSY